MQPPEPTKQPLPANPPHLMRLVKVRVRRPFCVKGQPMPIGHVTEIEYYIACDLAAIGKVELVEPA